MNVVLDELALACGDDSLKQAESVVKDAHGDSGTIGTPDPVCNDQTIAKNPGDSSNGERGEGVASGLPEERNDGQMNDGPLPAQADDPPVVFRPRRPRRLPPRRRITETDSGAQVNVQREQEEVANDDEAASEAALLRAAQRLRERARATNLRPHRTRSERGGRGTDAGAAASEHDATVFRGGGSSSTGSGLTSNFAVESSGYDAQRQMEAFVEARMADRFGARYLASKDDTRLAPPLYALAAEPPKARSHDGSDKDDEQRDELCSGGGMAAPGRSGQARTASAAEEELYAIPEHMQVPTRPQYDPTAGLPAAGVEEVDVGAVARRKNAEETAAARQRLLAHAATRRGLGADASPGPSCVVENLSANFERHRRDWIDTHLGPAPGSQGGSSSRGGGSGMGGRPAGGKRAPHGLATDHIVAERFRKRWRK
jgi:uncharacterized membrane protein YgcG